MLICLTSNKYSNEQYANKKLKNILDKIASLLVPLYRHLRRQVLCTERLVNVTLDPIKLKKEVITGSNLTKKQKYFKAIRSPFVHKKSQESYMQMHLAFRWWIKFGNNKELWTSKMLESWFLDWHRYLTHKYLTANKANLIKIRKRILIYI